MEWLELLKWLDGIESTNENAQALQAIAGQLEHLDNVTISLYWGTFFLYAVLAGMLVYFAIEHNKLEKRTKKLESALLEKPALNG